MVYGNNSFKLRSYAGQKPEILERGRTYVPVDWFLPGVFAREDGEWCRKPFMQTVDTIFEKAKDGTITLEELAGFLPGFSTRLDEVSTSSAGHPNLVISDVALDRIEYFRGQCDVGIQKRLEYLKYNSGLPGGLGRRFSEKLLTFFKRYVETLDRVLEAYDDAHPFEEFSPGEVAIYGAFFEALKEDIGVNIADAEREVLAEAITDSVTQGDVSQIVTPNIDVAKFWARARYSTISKVEASNEPNLDFWWMPNVGIKLKGTNILPIEIEF